MTKQLEALIAKIKKQTESFDTVVLKEGEAHALIAALEQAQVQPSPVMSKEMNPTTIRAVAAEWGHELDDDEANAAADSWNACRTAMLNGGRS